jgi:tetrapyrrole methylase family protein/MazG family protein
MTPHITVVGLGPAGPELITAATIATIERIPRRYLRTTRHPSAAVVADAISFDDVYDEAPSFDVLYAAIVEALVGAAVEHGEVLYAVPGSPFVAERTVALLQPDPRVSVTVRPALSYLDLAWAALGIDPLAAGVRLIDGRQFAVEAAGERGPLLVAQCDRRDVLSDIKLAVDDPPDEPVVVLHHLGLADQAVLTVPWTDLDRAVTPDHLTTLWIPSLAAPVGAEVVRFHELVRTLREQCPWDREQTHQTLTRHLVEETFELVEAIEELDGAPDDEHLIEELGDVLFQIEFHSVIAEQEGRFTMADVARAVHDKLVHRHPHVFGASMTGLGEAGSADQVLANWEVIKRAEKGRTSLFDGIPGGLPALAYAAKVQRKAASVGFDWDDVDGALPKIGEEAAELTAVRHDVAAATDELGDLLFAVVNVARHLDVDAEAALRAATAKFRRRFEAVEALARARGLVLDALDLPALDALWDEVKAAERATDATARPANGA